MKFLITITLLSTLLFSCTNQLTSSDTNIQRARERPSTHLYDTESAKSDVLAELEFGRKLAAKILGRYKLYDKPELTRYINLVGQSVAQNANRPEITFYFGILDTDHVNAYAAPGGYIFITRGALSMMQDEAELAAVLAHEVAHITEKHIVKELDIKGKTGDDSELFTKLLGSFTESGRALVNKILDGALKLLFDKGLKKDDEYEADKTGVILLTSSDYDPMALKNYLTRVSKLDKEPLKNVLNTHPSFSSRLAKLDQVIELNNLSAIEATKHEKRFNKNTKLN